MNPPRPTNEEKTRTCAFEGYADMGRVCLKYDKVEVDCGLLITTCGLIIGDKSKLAEKAQAGIGDVAHCDAMAVDFDVVNSVFSNDIVCC